MEASLVAKRRTRGEGSIHQRCITGVCPDLVDGNRPEHKCTGTWVGVVDLGKVGGKRVRKTVTAPTLRELRPKFKKLKSDTDSGVSHEDMTVREWFEHWLEHEVDRKRRPATANTYRRYVEKWVMPELGHLRLDRLRPAHLEALYARMQDDGKADATRRQVHAIIRRALVIAERQRLISWNPATKVDAPAVGKGSHGKFTLEEARRILDVLDDPSVRGSRWAVALLAGLRQGEALGLRWENVDFERGVLIIDQAVQQVAGRGIEIVAPKSDSSYRAVPMLNPVRAALWAERQPTGFVWGNGETPAAPRSDWAAWKAVLKLAGAPDRPLHAARATTSSLLMEAGVPDKIIAEILGHAQVQVTQRHYLHGDDRMHVDAMARMGELVAGTSSA
jgi:integrase